MFQSLNPSILLEMLDVFKIWKLNPYLRYRSRVCYSNTHTFYLFCYFNFFIFLYSDYSTGFHCLTQGLNPQPQSKWQCLTNAYIHKTTIRWDIFGALNPVRPIEKVIKIYYVHRFFQSPCFPMLLSIILSSF